MRNKGAEERNQVEIVSVCDYKVNPCIGCNSCFSREGNKCFQNVDMTAIYEKLYVGEEDLKKAFELGATL